MKTISLSDEILDKLKIIEGEEINEKIKNLLKTNTSMRLKECEDRIFEFESKYFMDFESFKKAWDEDSIKDKYSHRVERDFMEWEGFEYERKKWLKILQEVNVKI
jgi:hypothetical protein